MEKAKQNENVGRIFHAEQNGEKFNRWHCFPKSKHVFIPIAEGIRLTYIKCLECALCGLFAMLFTCFNDCLTVCLMLRIVSKCVSSSVNVSICFQDSIVYFCVCVHDLY